MASLGVVHVNTLSMPSRSVLHRARTVTGAGVDGPDRQLDWARHFGPPNDSYVLDIAAGTDDTAYALVYVSQPGLVIGPGSST